MTKVVRPDGKSWNYEYYGDLNGEAGSYTLKKVIYPLNGYVNYEYNNIEFYSDGNIFVNTGSNAVSKKTLSTGSIWRYAYNPAQNWGNYDTTTVTTPKGNITYEHIGVNTVSNGDVWKIGLLVSKKIGSDQTETYVYNSQKISNQNNQRIGLFNNKIDSGYYIPILSQKKISRSGQTYTTNYSQHDLYGNPKTITESGSNGGNRTTSVTYYINTSQWIINQVGNEVRSGTNISRSFDSKGNLLSISKNGIGTSYNYDSKGNITSMTDPRNTTTTYSNYKLGIARNEYQPESVSISRTVDDYGNISSETDGENKITSYGYDLLNRLTLVNYPIGNDISITYSGNTKTIRRGSSTKTITYDNFGRVTKADNGSGVYTVYGYDDMGMRKFISNPGSNSTGTYYTYDIIGRLTNLSFADGGSALFTYNGASVSYRDPRNNTTTYSYRSYGTPDEKYLMTVDTPALSSDISYTRDNRDLVTSMTQGTVTRNYTYYSSNYLQSINNPETGLTSYGRDAAGNMTSIKVGSTPTTMLVYDRRNRLTNINYPSGTPSVKRTYNKADRLTTVSTSESAREFDYDSNGNLTREVLSVDGLRFEANNHYNDNDYLDSITYPQTNKVVYYDVDSIGRVTSISGYINSINYHPSGQLSNIYFNNGVITSIEENSKLLMSKLTVGGSTTLVNNVYSYDRNGNLTQVNDIIGTDHDRTFTYDNLDRIDAASGTWGSGNFDFKDAGNISKKTLGSTSMTYNYDSANRLSSVSGSRSSSIAYDGYGNIKELFGMTFIFDAASNLVCENCWDDNTNLQHYYDGLKYRYKTYNGEHVNYEFHNANGLLLLDYSPTQGNKTVEYIYLNGQRIAQNIKADDVVQLQVKALLQGPYETTTQLMRDDLRTSNYIPSQSPYTGTTKSLNSSLLSTTGSNAIVDWALLELRNANDPSKVEHAYPVLLQRDGDLVDPESGSNTLLVDNVFGGNFYISIRHRNHLGVMTSTARNLQGGSTTLVDFTNITTAVSGTYARSETQGRALMWAGDANHDERIISSGTGSDLTTILTDILLSPSNTTSSTNYILTGYSNSDVNLDGKTIYSGAGSDTNYIVSNVLLNPGNINFASNFIVKGGMYNVVSQ